VHPNSQRQDMPETIQFRYLYREEDLRNYISKEVPSSRRGRIVFSTGLFFFLLCCLAEIMGTIAINVSHSFELLWDQLSLIPLLLFAQFLAFMAIVFLFVPTRLTTRLFHSLTWDGAEMLITISKDGWSRETAHWSTVVKFEGLIVKTEETADAFIINAQNGPILFLAKGQLPAEISDQLRSLLPMLKISAEI